jgi:hypothetical protein
VVAGKKRHELQSVLDEAIAHDYDSPLNGVSYEHNSVEGRTPLAYAVVTDKREVVRDLVDLGVDIDQRMGEATTALTLALMNAKRDCTEMVRILLSLDADPDPCIIAAAGIDEAPTAGQVNISVSTASMTNRTRNIHSSSMSPARLSLTLAYILVHAPAKRSLPWQMSRNINL